MIGYFLNLLINRVKFADNFILHFKRDKRNRHFFHLRHVEV